MAIPGNKTNFWFKIKAKQKRSLELNSESPAWNAIAITSLGHITLSQPQFSPPENGRTTTWQHSTTNWIWYLDKCAWHCSWYSSSPGTSSEPSRHSINMCWMIMKWKWENPQEPLLFFFFKTMTDGQLLLQDFRSLRNHSTYAFAVLNQKWKKKYKKHGRWRWKHGPEVGRGPKWKINLSFF